MLEALQDHYDVTLLSLTNPDISGLNSYYNTAVSEQKIEIQQIGWMTPALYKSTKRFHLMKNALVSRLVAQRSDEFDLIFCTYNELSLSGRSLQYIHMPHFRRWAKNENTDSSSGIYDEISKLIEGFDMKMIGSSRLLANSAWTAGVTEETYGTRPEVVYPPVDTTEFVNTPWTERENGFVTIGRLVPYKNVLRSINITKRLRDRGHDTHIHVIGPSLDSSYAERIKTVARDHDFVRLEGEISRTKLVELVSTHRYGIHGTDHEHFGMAVAELAAGGTIPFVPNGGGQREIVHERAELLYETADEAVGKIDRVLSNPKLQTGLSRQLNDIEERFGRDRFRKEIRKLVEEILHQNNP
ncbi:group 1 glycosyl transferase [Halococcus saccharolyticus DSM 5350]|uniref:Group 1 glycosyl transferase n=1 Tax=Halococcus saccharolyticus DSM 5350 TaxID=1227455 RepID=M0MS86_9EURY|nr:group 1 glycosyl transferase [Halococcus saccharolyticus DSM 5350]